MMNISVVGWMLGVDRVVMALSPSGSRPRVWLTELLLTNQVFGLRASRGILAQPAEEAQQLLGVRGAGRPRPGLPRRLERARDLVEHREPRGSDTAENAAPVLAAALPPDEARGLEPVEQPRNAGCALDQI